ncbi:mitotic fidelity of chromosome transmission- protein [Malassezia yamatoensis]|uniref:CENP-C homolog n=1 Tax=Malassezia yamatoensis TaxID=253288 RepID=A0AAJ5YYH1_9BASI|nr:mitotic fidelity of chromosome transmission- protein [Malassezia yamatoensis]
MSAAVSARRFREEGVGSRTGLRIGQVERDAQGNEDLDAFFAESKRVLDWMEQSDVDEDDQDEDDDDDDDQDDQRSGSLAPFDSRNNSDQPDWDRRAVRISKMAANSLGENETSTMASSRANDSMWDSHIDISVVRPFNLTELAGDQPTPTQTRHRRSTLPPADDTSWLRDTPRNESRADQIQDDTLMWMQRDSHHDSQASQFNADFSRDSSHRRDSAYDRSMWDDTQFNLSTFSRNQNGFTARQDSLPPDLENGQFPSSPNTAARYETEREPSYAESRASSTTPAPFQGVDALEPMEQLEEPYASTSAQAPLNAWGASVPEVAKKRGRGRPRKSETLRAMSAAGYVPTRGRPGRPPGRQMPPQKIIEPIYDPPSWQLNNPEGLRRGRRHRIPPLDWWRGERALYGRADAPEDAPTVPYGLVAPVLKKVVRVPRQPGEGTFSGMRKKRAKPMILLPERARSSEYPQASTADEAGLQTTDPYGVVYDAEHGEEVTMRIACNAQSLHPQPAFNRQFLYEKVFSLGEFMAAGLLIIPQGGEKQAKSSKDNNYMFVVFDGAVEVLVHRTKFMIAPGGMFCVPTNNTYNIRNVSDRDARIFFAQARNVHAPLTPVHRGGEWVFSHGDAVRAVQDLNDPQRHRSDSNLLDASQSNLRIEEISSPNAAQLQNHNQQDEQDEEDEQEQDSNQSESSDDVFQGSASESEASVSDDDFDLSRESRHSHRS